MALPLKNGADLYNFEMLRARLHNISAQPTSTDVGLGQIYFNTGSNTAASLRIGYCYETGATPKFHHLATLVDIEDLQTQIDNIDFASSEEFTSLKEKVDAFLDESGADSDKVLDNLKEIQDFLDAYDGVTSLVDLLATKADKATTLDGYGITDAVYWRNGDSTLPFNISNNECFKHVGYGYSSAGWHTNGPAISIGHSSNYIMQMQMDISTGDIWRRLVSAGVQGNWFKILDSNNYASVLGTVYAPYHSAGYLPLTGGTLSGHLQIDGTYRMKLTGGLIELNDANGGNGVFLWNGLAIDRERNLYIYNGAWYSALHSGNFNSYAPTLTGTGASGTWGIDISGKAKGLSYVGVSYDLESISYNGLFQINTATPNAPYSYATGLQLSNVDSPIAGTNGHFLSQLVFGFEGAASIKYRSKINTQDWSNWKTLAFTDSDITGYAAGLKHSNGTIGAIVNSSGNVGIGTSSPAYKLDVGGTVGVLEDIINRAAKTYNSPFARGYLWEGTSGTIGGLFGYGLNGESLEFINLTLGNNYASTSGICLLKGGNVGIGTTTPQKKLHVVGDVYVTGNIIADGQVSSGGIADEAASGGSGLEKVVFTLEAGQTSYKCAHNLATREITVSIYEEGDDYQQVLTDVYLDDANTARIVFGSATDVAHKVVIVG